MPMDFLRRIENASFPLAVHEKADIHCTAVLADAELVEANLQDASDSAGRGGVILRITPLGRAELNRLRDEQR
ncbi:hypothetical protein VLK31_33905 [Variovorax sp. H27-G14]|uniref:hypothetical protein n=1 Tax=Variovorax sp. H27-G14 TaxID=3111914 RepID=UPI0038FC6DE9